MHFYLDIKLVTGALKAPEKQHLRGNCGVLRGVLWVPAKSSEQARHLRG